MRAEARFDVVAIGRRPRWTSCYESDWSTTWGDLRGESQTLNPLVSCIDITHYRQVLATLSYRHSRRLKSFPSINKANVVSHLIPPQILR